MVSWFHGREIELGLFPNQVKGLTAPIYTQSPFTSRSRAPDERFWISPCLKALYHIIWHIFPAVRARAYYWVFAITFFGTLYFACGHLILSNPRLALIVVTTHESMIGKPRGKIPPGK